jgi:hypothetical protein
MVSRWLTKILALVGLLWIVIVFFVYNTDYVCIGEVTAKQVLSDRDGHASILVSKKECGSGRQEISLELVDSSAFDNQQLIAVGAGSALSVEASWLPDKAVELAISGDLETLNGKQVDSDNPIAHGVTVIGPYNIEMVY